MSGQHAFLAPSNAAVWRLCAGAAAMQQAYPEPPDSPKSMQGTAAHWGAKELLYGRPIDVGLVTDNGVALDAEMIEHVGEYAEVIKRDMERDPPQYMYCEQPIAIPNVHEQNWGTPDFWMWRPGLLRLYDFKYGHMLVEVFENWQMLDYTSGILSFLGIDGHTDQHTRVEFIIVQPRSFGRDGTVRRWDFLASDIRGHINSLRMAAQAATAPNAPLTSGSQCKWCSAAHVCPALQKDAQYSMDVSEQPIAFQMAPVQLGYELRNIQRAQEILEARERGLMSQVEGFLDKGQQVPFYHLDHGRGSTVWKQTKKAVIAFGQMMGVNLAKEPDVITPIQAKKLAIDPSLIDSMSEHRNGERKVKAIDSLTVRKAFSQ